MIFAAPSQFSIQFIAPGSGNIHQLLPIAEKFLQHHSIVYNKFIPFTFHDPLYIAAHHERLASLKEALMGPVTSVLWALRGGNGTVNLLPELKLLQPSAFQWIVGFSDITALHLMVIKLWNWITIHGPTLNYAAHISSEPQDDYWQPTIDFITKGQLNTCIQDLVPLNDHAQKGREILGLLMGGNMSLIQASIGTFWQIETSERIIFFEDVNEAPYRIAGRLEHLQQAGLFKHVRAILFGDFTSEQTSGEDQVLINYVLKSFAQSQNIPVFKNLPTGHGLRNIPLLLNYPATVHGGKVGQFKQIFNQPDQIA